MQLARAELVDYLPAGRTRALVCLGDDDYVLLIRKGSVDGEQTAEEMTELLQAMLGNGAGDHDVAPTPLAS